uniref:Uncharacterized protein n=1 Tax=Anopheles culicifacies TaxID=139723 RepID=A0A182LXL2_9DIPT
MDDQLPLDSAARAEANQQKMVSFLAQNFMLSCANTMESAIGNAHHSTPSKSSSSHGTETDGGTIDGGTAGKLRRMPRRSRQVVTLAKCTQIPLSSPLGLFMLKTSKIVTTPEYLLERFDRMERFCNAPPLPPGTGYPLRPGLVGCGLQEALTAPDRRLPKWLFGKVKTGYGPNGCTVTFKRLPDDAAEPSTHVFKFPRRQFSTKHRVENFLFYNKLLLQRCRPCAVRIERLTSADVQELALLPGIEREQREAEEAARQERQRRKEIAEIAESAMVIDSIDLCSSDEDFEPELIAGEGQRNAPQHKHDSSSDTIFIPHDIVETIVLERDDSMGSDTNEFTHTNDVERSSAEQILNSGVIVHPDMVPKIAKKSFFGTMLSESTYRLNQSLPVGNGNGKMMEGAARQPLTEPPLYLYAHCSQTTVNVSEDAPFSSGTRLHARKGTSSPLKENLVNGFGSTGANNSANGDGLLPGAGSQYAATPVPLHQAPVQPRSVMLGGPVTNGHAIIGTIPVPFGSGSNLHSRTSASVVQTLTTATYTTQVVHTHTTIKRSKGPSAAAIPSPTVANLHTARYPEDEKWCDK